MRYRPLLNFIVLSLGLVSGELQGQRTPLPTKATVSTIRDVDFQNFAYRDQGCNDGKTVRVKKGNYSEGPNGHYFRVDDIQYVELNADGVEEAIVQVSCGLNGANFFPQEVFVFKMQGTTPVLMGIFDEGILQRDYQRYYHPTKDIGYLWRPVGRNPALAGGVLSFEYEADGPHCCPTSVVTLKYRWNGSSFVLAERPAKRPLQSP